MITKAKLSYARSASTKMARVIDLIRGKDVGMAFGILSNVEQAAAVTIKKLLNSAVSNARQKGLTEDQLVISKITADKGPMWKRFRAAGFGRATNILKRTTHLTIELDLKVRA